MRKLSTIRRSAVSLTLGLFFGMGLASFAQPTLNRRPAPAPDYVLGAGDQIVLHVTDMEELTDKPLRIDPNGFVDLPLAGRVLAAGLTTEQFKAVLVEKLAKYIDSPQITLNLTDDQNRPVSVVGQVGSPGVHQLQGPKRLIEVISLAGGVKPDAGPRVIVTRENKWGLLPIAGAKTDLTTGVSTASLSLDDLMASKNPSDNIEVQPNDVISIPKADLVYVVGNVKRSGGFQLSSHANMTLLQAVSLAEGLDKTANASHARILRPAPGGDGKTLDIPVDIKAIFAGKSPDVPLYGNDILFVPNSTFKSSGRITEGILLAATGAAIYRF